MSAWAERVADFGIEFDVYGYTVSCIQNVCLRFVMTWEGQWILNSVK